MKAIMLHQPKRRRRWIVLLSTFLITWTLIISTVVAGHRLSCDETYYYRTVTGDNVSKIKWELKKTDIFTLNYQTCTSQYVTTTDADFDTRCWQVVDEGKDTFLRAERVAQAIVVKGRHQGSAIDKSLAIDPNPWYQATSLSLREFIASDDSERIFWIIRPNTLTVHKIKATKQEVLTKDSVNGQRSLLRIRLSLTGMLAPFWKSDYWFSIPEGIFQRFEGPSGPPGSPLTVVTLMGPSNDRKQRPGPEVPAFRSPAKGDASRIHDTAGAGIQESE